MTIVESSLIIHRPVEKVFDYVTDLANHKKLSAYITGITAEGSVKLGTKFKTETESMGHKNTSVNEVVAFEPNKKFGVKTFAAPPASDLTNTYLFEADGGNTALTLQLDAVLVPAGAPNIPGMEDIMKKQLVAGLEATLAAWKKLIEA